MITRRSFLALATGLGAAFASACTPAPATEELASTLFFFDTVCTLRGVMDRDVLDGAAALCAAEIQADVLLLAKNVDGIYDSDPKINPNATLIREVKEVNDEILALASGVSDGGRGGMETKLLAARMVTRFGGRVIIACGKEPFIIRKLFDGQDFGTIF